MKNAFTTVITAVVLATAGLGCAAAQQIATTVVDVSSDVCTLISQNDPTAPTSVQVACKVEGSVGPVVLNLPWAAWQAMLAKPAARTAPKTAVKH